MPSIRPPADIFIKKTKKYIANFLLMWYNVVQGIFDRINIIKNIIKYE